MCIEASVPKIAVDNILDMRPQNRVSENFSIVRMPHAWGYTDSCDVFGQLLRDKNVWH